MEATPTARMAASRYRRRRRDALNNLIRTVLLMIVSLVVGVLVGLVAYPHIPFPGSPASLPGKVEVTEDDLGVTLGSYTYQGRQTNVTVREAIEESSSLEAAKNDDGTYEMPSVDEVLAIARNRILAADAASRGIAATEEDAAAYAEATLGTSDYASIAAGYGMDVDQAKERMRSAATLRLLRDAVVTTQPVDAPQEPAAPEAGREDEPMDEYARYVIALAGDEWDAAANAWARDDGPYRNRLRDYTVSNEAATYSAARAAYLEAYEQYCAVQQQIAAEWTLYVNGILSEVTVELGSLVA